MFLIVDILRLHGLIESYSLCCDYMLQRASLNPREDGGVNYLGHLLDDTLRGGDAPWIVEVFANQDDAPARAAKGLVGG